MRIGIDATTIYTNRPTGLGIYSINIINELAKLHDDIVVWTVDDSALDLPQSKIRKVLQPFRFLGNSLFLLRAVWVELVLPRLVKRERVDLLYTTVPNGSSTISVPHVVTVHDLIPLLHPSDASKLVSWNFKYRLPKILKKAAAIVVVSEHTKNDLIVNYKINENKIFTVIEGFNKDIFKPTADKNVLEKYGLGEEKYLLYVGNVSSRKNVMTILNVFSMVSCHIPHKLLLAGSKSSGEYISLRSKSEELGIADRVIMTDYVPFDDLPVLYSNADVFLFLSLYEGFGLPVLEAMACGAPVLASNTTSIPEVAGDAAFLVNPIDRVAVSGVLLKVLSDQGVRERLITSGFEHSSRFSWRNSAEQLLTCLHKSCKFGGR